MSLVEAPVESHRQSALSICADISDWLGLLEGSPRSTQIPTQRNPYPFQGVWVLVDINILYTCRRGVMSIAADAEGGNDMHCVE